VVDTGRHKEKIYSTLTGVSKFEISWISQAAADQRAGRSGRTGPGRCYRLYSSAVFQDFPQFPPPEISQRPLDDLVLGMKSFGIDQIKNFPFVTPPNLDMLVNAEKLCVKLGALESSKEKRKVSGRITPLGTTIKSFPVSPRFGRILSISAQQDLLNYAVALVAACTVRELIDHQNEKMKQLKHIWTDSTKIILGDLLVLLSAIGATAASAEPTKFAVAIGIRPQGLKEVHNLRRLISHSVRPLLQTDDIESLNVKFSPPNSQQCKLLSELFLSGFGDQIGFLTGEEHEYKISGQDLALIHPHSVLFKRKIKIVAFQEKMENSKGHVYLKGFNIVLIRKWAVVFFGYNVFLV
jgi:ATP-dependent RNA helicase DHX37/DHR1